MKTYLTQCVRIAGEEICGPISSAPGEEINIAWIINKLISLVFPLSGVLLFFFLVLGGYDFLMSAGNPEKIKSGQAKMTAAVIGFILLVASYLIVRLVAMIFGLEGVL